jgi:hypothetical protein
MSAEHSMTFVPQNTIGFIGQYYTVNGFGVTRLYTTVHCLNKNNRYYIEGLLKSFGFMLPDTHQIHHKETLRLGGQ